MNRKGKQCNGVWEKHDIGEKPKGDENSSIWKAKEWSVLSNAIDQWDRNWELTIPLHSVSRCDLDSNNSHDCFNRKADM